MSTPFAARLSEVAVTYRAVGGNVRALDGIDVEFPRGSSTAVVGRSGSGKSTLVSILSLLRRPTSGTFELGGVDTGELRPREVAELRSREIGIVFQSFHLEPSLDAVENVSLAWAFGSGRGTRRAARAKAIRILDTLDIAELAGRRPNEMSGGQRQRVAIARALFTEPTLFIADEPTGNLDEDTANEVADIILSLPAAFGTTVALVTHDRAVASRAERRLELVRGTVRSEDAA